MSAPSGPSVGLTENAASLLKLMLASISVPSRENCHRRAEPSQSLAGESSRPRSWQILRKQSPIVGGKRSLGRHWPNPAARARRTGAPRPTTSPSRGLSRVAREDAGNTSRRDTPAIELLDRLQDPRRIGA